MHSMLLGLAVLCLGQSILAVPTQIPSPSLYPIVKDEASNVSFQGVSHMNIESFLNIKFGRDTSGANRFAAPKPLEYESGSTINATSPGAACPQQRVSIPGVQLFPNVTNVSEDCLTLRVDRPTNTTADAKLPVLLWIYGGGDTIGEIYGSTYDPAGLVSGSVSKGLSIVFAAMNNRLGFFGFSAFADNSSDAVPNAGLLDQRLGMEWIQKHIASFGGDPDNVTIFGESDGATAVGLHITAFGGKQPAPFKRAIMESGAATADQGVISGFSQNNTLQLTKVLTCSNSNHNTSQSVACLRGLSLDQILPTEVNFTFAFDKFGGFDTFIPTVDDNFIPAAPSQLLAHGNFSKNISTIIGWNQDDGSLFVAPSPVLFANSSFLQPWAATTFHGLNESAIETVLSLYPASSSTFAAMKAAFPTIPVVWMRASQIQRDSGFVCPGLLQAQALMKYNSANPDVSTYLHNLNVSLFAPFLAAENLSCEGVTHFSDIAFGFNQAAAENATEEYVALAHQIGGSWVQFAYTGRPTVGTVKSESSSNWTLSDWPAAVNTSSELKSGDLAVKVINVVGQEVVSVGSDLALGENFGQIGARCAFWNSPEILEGLGV